METFNLEVKERGRVVLPAGLRGACGFEAGTRLVARVVGPGRVVVETTDALAEEIWADAPGAPVGAVAELWNWRAEEASRLDSDALGTGEGTEDKTADVLSQLGLA